MAYMTYGKPTTRQISALTAAQQAEFPRFVRKWIEIGLSTEPADRPRAEAASKKLYAMAGFREPLVLWLPCPISAAITASWYGAWLARQRIPKLMGRGGHPGFDESAAETMERGFLKEGSAPSLASILDAARKATDVARVNVMSRTEGDLDQGMPAFPTYQAVANQVRASILDKLGASVHRVVAMQVHDAVRVNVELAVDHAIGRIVKEAVQAALDGAHMERTWFGGALSPGFASWADFLYEMCGVTFDRSFLELTESCGQFWAMDGLCIISERPSELHRDHHGRLHNVHGMAISYPSGWGLYRWHGFKVPRNLLQHPERINVRRIDSEQNIEIRRAMIESYGMVRYLVESGARIISHDAAGILYRKKQPRNEPIVMVRVLNSTPEPDGVMTREEAILAFGEAAQAAVNAPKGTRFKEYVIRVPPTMVTASQAVAWTFGLEREEYHPALES